MSRCPVCGYEEPPIWRNRRWRIYQQYARIDELESWKETRELASILRNLGPSKRGSSRATWTDGHYNYQFKRDGFVIRIPRKLAKAPDLITEPDTEKSRPPRRTEQKTILSVIE